MDKNQLKELIEDVLRETNLYSEEAVELLLGTCAVESNLGQYIEQMNNGPAQGIFQMEPATEFDIWKNYLNYRDSLRADARAFMADNYTSKLPNLKYNLAYQILMARIHYLRVPEKLPAKGDRQAQARYWKKYYNTELGKGTVEKYLQASKKYL